MTSSSSTIIRIPRTDTDQEDDCILGEVVHSGGSSGRGSKPLNLKIIATEGEEPYALTRKSPGILSLFLLLYSKALCTHYLRGIELCRGIYPAMLMSVHHLKQSPPSRDVCHLL